MTDYKATPEQWEHVHICAGINHQVPWATAACLLELRARIEALETQTYQWRCDHLLLANACASIAPNRSKFFADLMPDGDEDDTNKYPSSSQQVSVASLVERVVMAIGRDGEPARWNEARAVIREVAGWLQEEYPSTTATAWARCLIQELEP